MLYQNYQIEKDMDELRERRTGFRRSTIPTRN